MSNAISNTSPLLYLDRIGAIELLPILFQEIWVPAKVLDELSEGHRKGYEVPILSNYAWIEIVSPQVMPSEWLALDLGAGELAAISLALENPDRMLLLDDMFARRNAQAAGLTVWGTLKIILEAKSQGIISEVAPLVDRLNGAGMWLSVEIRKRILVLAQEAHI